MKFLHSNVLPTLLVALLLPLAAYASKLPDSSTALPQALSQGTPAKLPAPLQLDAGAEALVKLALTRSPEVARVAARLHESAALSLAAESSLWPRLTLNGGHGLVKESPSDSSALASAGNTRRSHLAANFAWEFDIFGQQRANRRAGRAEHAAAQAELAAAQVLLANAVRAEIIQLRSAQEELHLAQTSLASWQESLTLEEQLRAAGLRSQADLQQLGSALKANEAQVIKLASAVELAALRLRTLSDVPLAEIKVRTAGKTYRCQLSAPQAVPLAWLSRRPDVVAAEQRLHASLALADSSRAAIWPTFSLSASQHRQRDQASALSNIISHSSQQLLGINLLWTLFDGGQRQAETQAAKQRASASAAGFRRVVLQAAEETEGSLTRLAIAEQAANASAQAHVLAEQARAHSQRRWQAGIDSKLSFNQVQRETQERHLQALVSERERCLLSIELNRALALQENDGQRQQ